MRDAPLHESHLLEAVRKKVLTSQQMEEVLAIARSTPAGGAIRDVGWATVVQGLIAGAAVLGSGMGLLIDSHEHGADLGMAAYSALGLVASLLIGQYLHRFSWGRVPGSIVRAGAAVWSFGVVLGLLSVVMPLQRYVGVYDGRYSAIGYNERLHTAFAVANFASIAVAFALWRFKRCAPALGIATVHALMLTLPLMEHASSRGEALIVLGAGSILFTMVSLSDRLSRGAVDGGFWVYPAAMFPMGVAALIRIDRDESEVFVWLPLALLMGGLAYSNGRRFPMIFSAIAVVIFPAFALAESRAPSGIVIGALVASAAAVAAAVQAIRNRDLSRAAPAGDPPSIWG